MATVNSELLRLAKQRLAKQAAVMPDGTETAAAAAQGPGGMPADPMAAAGAPPAGAGGPPPMSDPNVAAAGTPAIDPNAMAAQAQPPMPAQPQPAAGTQQKLKPEQMMQMIDYRLYNMQQQLTAIMNAMGVQLPPEAIVLPPGSTAAPAPETALPGGPGAPAAPAAAPAGGGQPAAQLPQDVYMGGDPTQNGGAVPPIAPAKAAWWQQEEPKAASYIGDPVPVTEDSPASLSVSADAMTFLLRSLNKNAS